MNFQYDFILTREERLSKFDTLQQSIRSCDLCVKAGCLKRANPITSGNIDAGVILVGQAPGIKNADERFPFNGGPAGRRLFDWLRQAGWAEDDFRNQHYITSVTRCFPGKNKAGTGDRIPSLKERELCRKWLDEEMRLLDVKLIILMGRLSINTFFDSKLALSDVIGKKYQFGRYVVIPIPHPSGASTWYLKKANRLLLSDALSSLSEVRKELKL